MFEDLRLRAILALSRSSLFALDALTGRFNSLQTLSQEELTFELRDPGLPGIEASLCTPTQDTQAAVLLFHGIGERIVYWRRVQQLLAAHGIASLIFQYPGYGCSAGPATTATLHRTSITAYQALLSYMPTSCPVFLLGLSLGTAIAADVAPSLIPAPRGIILAQPFCSLRKAAGSITRFSIAALLVPDIYRLDTALKKTSIPTLIVHVTGDQLFSCESTRQLVARLQLSHVTLVAPTGHAHNSLFVDRHADNWFPVLKFIKDRCQP